MRGIDLAKDWIRAMLDGLETEVDEPTRRRLMEKCGRACAAHHKSVEIVNSVRKTATGIDELLDALNRQEGFWCGDWKRDGKLIYSVCDKCGCPMVSAGLVEPSPALCDCSRGWVEAVFRAALGAPVEVQLALAIGRGDRACRYVVKECPDS